MPEELQPESDVDPTWVHLAACRGMDPALFFPENDPGPAEALAVCSTCPVAAECLDDAYRHHELGVRGGTTYSWRRHHPRQGAYRTTCQHCGTEFAPPTRNHFYCSTECRRAVHSARAADRYRARSGMSEWLDGIR